MVSSFRLEDKLNDATNFKGMHLYMLFKLYHPASMSVLVSNDLGSSTFRGTSTPSLVVEAPGLIDQIVKFQIAHIKFDSCYSTSKHYSCDNNL
jgi:hypothetical protein